ncbi:MAG TPA: 6-carboxytetrahydropterin synthase [Bacteroidota bacterium]|nr:6-carboxytetrahydropterin synthase [Bacteroidota bacterium]
MMKIGKEFHWEMGHRLPTHTRGCQNIHGHSYRLMVEVEGEPGANGMLVDYTDLKAIVKPMIDRLDHSFMCDESDTRVKDFLESSAMKTVFVPFPTTAENIGTYLLRHLTDAVMKEKSSGSRAWDGIKKIRIRVCETASTYAEMEATL